MQENDRDQVFPGVGDLCLRICLIGLAENLVSISYEIVLVLYFHSFNILKIVIFVQTWKYRVFPIESYFSIKDFTVLLTLILL